MLHGRPLLGHQLALLDTVGVHDVVAVTGYRAAAIRDAFPSLQTVEYEGYASSNNLWTLAHQRNLLSGEVLVLFGDVLVTPRPVIALLNDPAEAAVLIDANGRRPGTMRVARYGRRVTSMGAHLDPDSAGGNFVGLARLRGRASIRLAQELEMMGRDERHRHDYYTSALVRLPSRGVALMAVDLAGEPWLEIDTVDDLEAARSTDFYVIRR
jgi:choline kinase